MFMRAGDAGEEGAGVWEPEDAPQLLEIPRHSKIPRYRDAEIQVAASGSSKTSKTSAILCVRAAREILLAKKRQQPT